MGKMRNTQITVMEYASMRQRYEGLHVYEGGGAKWDWNRGVDPISNATGVGGGVWQERGIMGIQEAPTPTSPCGGRW